MVFVMVYLCVFLLGLWFSFGFVVVPLGLRLCLSFVFMLLLCSFGFLRIRIYRRAEVCYPQSTREKLRRGKICFSPPPPLGLAEDQAMAGVQSYRNDKDELGDGGVRRCWHYRDGLCAGEYIFRRPLGR